MTKPTNSRAIMTAEGIPLSFGQYGGNFNIAPSSDWGGDDRGVLQAQWHVTDEAGVTVLHGVGGATGALPAGDYTLHGSVPGALVDIRQNNAPQAAPAPHRPGPTRPGRR